MLSSRFASIVRFVVPGGRARRLIVLPSALVALAAVGVPAASAAVDVKINFQPTASLTPAGYTKDVGSAFDATRGFGWVRADSLTLATHTPLDLTLNTRERTTVTDLRQATFIHMAFPTTSSSSGTTTPGAWEMTVPNGKYSVTVGVGDSDYYDSVHHINAEGATLLPNFTPSAATPFQTASGVVTVSDGRLTIDQNGGTNTKLDYIDIKDADSTPPAQVTGVTAVPGDGEVDLSWNASTASDFASYSVYRGTSATVSTTGTPLKSGLTTANYTDATAANGTTYYYVVVARDSSGNASTPSAAVSATPVAATASSVAVNFQTATTTTPSGYQPDYGQAYDAARGYGWVDASSGAALSLVGNGRERGVNPDKRLDTFMSMQLKAGSDGVPNTGSWKAKVANGTYQVTIAVGDPSYIDSHHVINVEGQPMLDFTPSAAQLSETNTITVPVTDGFLNVDATGGTNTKIDYLTAQPVSATSPHVTAVTPAANATNVCRDGAVTVQLSDGVDPTTATAAGFQVLTAGGTQISGFYNTDGAYSNATFVPSAALSPNATYTVKTTTALKSPAGVSYTPFTSTFTTSDSTCATAANVNFNTSNFDFSDGTAATTTAYKTEGPSAMALGPNPNSPTQLWVAFGTGNILVYNLNPTTGLATGAPTQVTTFKFQRIVSGLRFDASSTATNIKLWVSNGQFGCDLAAIGVACDDFTGAISTLTGTSTTALTKTDIVTGLPRSVGNHMNNGIDFGPDGALYLAQGAENGYGAPDPIWGNRSEDPLSAAVLRIDLAGIGSNIPYNVNTSTGYNPNASTAKVKTYATGIRNPFSLLWHTNGKLYAPVNESASGNTPADPAGGAPALNDLPSFDDYFTQVVAGKYYGHPNPSRGEYRLNGGNPTAGVDPFEVPQYPVGTQPNSNWRQPDMDLGIHRSADGSAQYKSNVFGTELKDKILVTEYSQGKDILAIALDANGKPVSKSVVASGFYNPLPIAVDQGTGRIYVGEYGRDPDGVGGKLTLLTPNPVNTSTGYHVNFETTTTATPAGYSSDSGSAFDAVRGYGWEDNSTGAALSLIGNGRERGVASDKRLDTFMQMQAKVNSGITTPGRWEMVVPNGTYTLTVGAGDPSYTDSHDVINAEGTKILDFTPTAANPTTTVTTTVTISDGRLTLTPTNGDNTKISFVDLVPTTGNPPVTGNLQVSSPEDKLGLGSRMVFSTVANEARTGHSLTVKNLGTASVNITGLTFGGTNAADFQLCSGQSTSFALAGGASTTICVQYRPTVNAATAGTQISQGTLTIATTATGGPYAVTLGGLNTKGYEGLNEPNLQQIFDAVGYKNNAAVTNKPVTFSISPSSMPVGDEVLAPYFKALDTSKAVSLTPLARYGAGLGGADSQQFGWHAKGSTTNSFLYALPGGNSTAGQNNGYGQNQLLLPTTTTGTTTFSPGGVFGVVDGSGWHTDDALNANGKWHNFRVWPAKNAAGTVIPGTYIVAEDIYEPINQASKNWDYQDFVFVLTNATPDTASSQPTAGEVAKALASFPGTAGGISNTGFTTAQGTVTAAKIAMSGGQLNITTSADTDTTHTNALQLGVNLGTGSRIQSRLVGPFTAIDAGQEQQGIYVGPSGSNYLKADVEWSASTNSRRLVIAKMLNGTLTTVTSAALPAGTIDTLDLRIEVNPTDASSGAPYATVSYAVNGATTFTTLSTANIALPTSWITANTPAGILTSNQGGAAFTATFASFSIARNY